MYSLYSIQLIRFQGKKYIHVHVQSIVMYNLHMYMCTMYTCIVQTKTVRTAPSIAYNIHLHSAVSTVYHYYVE